MAKKPTSTFMKPMTISPELAEIIGDGPYPRTEVTKLVWEYIKEHGLQDAKDKRVIVADSALRKVFGGQSRVDMFKMTKLINDHLS
jgi:upstream activation factor subunit UAF30